MGSESGRGRPAGSAWEGGAAVLAGVEEMPGGAQALEVARGRGDAEVVGGAVRDLLLGREPREVDVVVDGERGRIVSGVERFVGELQERLAEDGVVGEGGCEVTVHERFGTAAVRWEGGAVDVAARRFETYRRPGELPEVAAGSAEQDLGRRDFTVNAIAVAVGGEREGEVRAVEGALADLREGRLRVLHGGSFLDDPIRLMRLCRYAGRLGFAVEEETERLAREAVAGGALGTVSAARVGAELRLLAAEEDPGGALAKMRWLGVLAALDGRLRLDEGLLREAQSLLGDDGDRGLLALASLLVGGARERPFEKEDLAEALEGWEFTVGQRRVLVEAAEMAVPLARSIAAAELPSELYGLLDGVSVETVALAGAVASGQGSERGRGAAGEWLSRLRHVKLRITGEDLLTAGIQEGPEVGRRLRRTLMERMDGKIEEGREAELRAALR